MKQYLTVMARLTVAVLAAGVVFAACSDRQTTHVDAQKIVQATRAYKADLKAKGLSVPATVTLRELQDRGLLAASDVSGFTNTDVTVNLLAGDSPQDVLVRARLADGQEIVLLGDGSVQKAAKDGAK